MLNNPRAELSDRHLKALQRTAYGLANVEIAGYLVLSEKRYIFSLVLPNIWYIDNRPAHSITFQ